MIEIENKNEVLEAPMGAILGTIIELIEEENLKEAMMIMQFLDDEKCGYQFNIECKKVKPTKKGLFDRILKRGK